MLRSPANLTGLLVAFAVAAALAGCGSTKTVTETVTVTTPAPTQTGLGTPSQWNSFGHLKSLKPVGNDYEMLFDPSVFLSGETANKAAAEDGVIEPGEPMPNDNYKVDERHRNYFYIVPSDAKVTVLTNAGDPPQLESTPISVAELAKIIDGASDMELYEPLDTGVWILTKNDKVLTIDQQYAP